MQTTDSQVTLSRDGKTQRNKIMKRKFCEHASQNGRLTEQIFNSNQKKQKR